MVIHAKNTDEKDVEPVKLTRVPSIKTLPAAPDTDRAGWIQVLREQIFTEVIPFIRLYSLLPSDGTFKETGLPL